MANEVDGDVAADAAGGVTAQGTASDAMASVTCDEAAPAQEPVAFRNVTCHGTVCNVNVELGAGEISVVSSDGGQSVDGLPLVLPLELVQEFKATTATPKVAACLLTIPTDAMPLELSFLAQTAFAAIQKEHVKARDRFLCALEAATSTTTCAPPTAEDPVEKTSVTTRVRRGRELRELLQRVSQLHSANKPKQAEQLLESAPAADSGGSAALVHKRAQQLRTELFSNGGLEVTRSILKTISFTL